MDILDPRDNYLSAAENIRFHLEWATPLNTYPDDVVLDMYIDLLVYEREEEAENYPQLQEVYS